MRFFVPVKTVNPLNGTHRHWRAVAAGRRRQREAVVRSWLADLSAEARACERGGPFAITLTRCSSGTLDGDGLQAALKTIRDQVADCLGFRNDADPALTWIYAQRKCARGVFGVEVEIK